MKNSPYASCLKYIESYWKKLECYNPVDRQLHFGMPNKYIVPNHEIFHYDQFYWDSYFVILGLVKVNKVDIARGMVENFMFLFNRFNIVPMRNRYYNLGTSQIPFLSSMIFEVYNVEKKKNWLKKSIRVAELELKNYWMNSKLTEKHIMSNGLSRYCDHYITHLGAEHESGWDMTSRFNDRCLDYLPIDLNCCLYKYEMDISEAWKILGDQVKAKKFRLQARARKKQINLLMWNLQSKFFFDYNRKKKQQSTFFSVAGFYPLWSKLATPEQAELIREHVLPLFEYEGGITNTQSHGLAEEFKQHDHPNGWPPQQWIVIKGLLNYGFKADAERLAKKWLDMNVKIFKESGKLWEKHNVEKCTIGLANPDRYLTQSGFGWTNAIFVRLLNELDLK